MKYFYIHPFKPQYFFPKGFKKHALFLDFFSPYSKVGRISWFLFIRFSFYRVLFSKSNIEQFIPEGAIKRIVGEDTVMAFNTGTVGPEQKITGLGVINNKEFFIKYGQTKIAMVNVTNEYNILKQIDHLNIVPKVLDFYSDNNHVLLKTDVLEGKRLKDQSIDKNIIDQLILLSNQKVNCSKTLSSNLLSCFSHGDFCPWNMMANNGDILLFDWEMAGAYTLGYDLFTYIFQTRFLLNPETPIKNILVENIKAIAYYFSHFNINDWNPYLRAFIDHKISLEQLKGDKSLLTEYLKLLEYAKEA
ncbi:phosphotransferase [Flavobacteriaceae bacterium]|nr:phosphotransferase [Flavobacteriaceae bacterium]